MRTTIDLPEYLLREVTDAIRRGFGRRAVPTYAGGGVKPGANLDDSPALLDLMERGS
jgi:hypothetical protein